jgi:hypothetical protein
MYTHQHDHEVTAGNGFTNDAWTGTVPVSTDYNAILDLTHIFSASTVLDVKASYGHSSSNDDGKCTPGQFYRQ